MQNSKITSLVFFLFLLVVHPMLLEAQIALVPETPTKLEDQFSMKQVNYAQLQSFQERGTQKFQEFSDLVNLVSNPALDNTFRKEAQLMAQQLFYDSTATLKVYDFKTQSVKNLSLQNYLDNLYKNKESTFQLQLDTFNTAALPYANENNPIWQLNYRHTLTSPSGDTKQLNGAMEVLLKKVDMNFGSEKKSIWKVMLGDVKQLEISN